MSFGVLQTLKFKRFSARAAANLVKGQDVFIIQPTGLKKSLRHKQGQRLTRSAVSLGRIKNLTRETAEIEPTFLKAALNT